MAEKKKDTPKFKRQQSVIVVLHDQYGQTKNDVAKNAEYNAKIGVVSSIGRRGSDFLYFIKMGDGVTLQMTEDCLLAAE